MSAKKVYACARCWGEVDPKRARLMAGRYWHFECPARQFERILQRVLDEMEEEA